MPRCRTGRVYPAGLEVLGDGDDRLGKVPEFFNVAKCNIVVIEVHKIIVCQQANLYEYASVSGQVKGSKGGLNGLRKPWVGCGTFADGLGDKLNGIGQLSSNHVYEW